MPESDVRPVRAGQAQVDLNCCQRVHHPISRAPRGTGEVSGVERCLLLSRRRIKDLNRHPVRTLQVDAR